MGFISRFAINRLVNSTDPRPRPFSFWSEKPPTPNNSPISDYTSWNSLTDREWSGRHLPPASDEFLGQLPFAELVADTRRNQDGTFPADVVDQVTTLHKRSDAIVTDRSTVLYSFFAQWFTDSFLRFDSADRRKNTSNHEIDLCQLYGLTDETCRILRTMADGKLLTREVNGEDYLPLLFDAQHQPIGDFNNLPYINKIDFFLAKFPVDRRDHYYATGLDRGNTTIGYTAISTVFLREHNRLCGELKERNGWTDDERLFQTARNILIVLLLKVVVEDYISHIAGLSIFRVEPGFAEKQKWYRTNWMAAEFDLLYRWHPLVPDEFTLDGTAHGHMDYRFNNLLLEQHGVAAVLSAASSQAAGKIGLHNTPDFLLPAEYEAIKMSRDFKLRSFNEYRRRFGLRRVRSFKKLTKDENLQDELESLYGDIDKMDFLTGLFAEQSSGKGLFGDLMTTMVACDAFSQALTNPLLSKYIFNENTFTRYGMEVIEATSSFEDIARRNVAGELSTSFSI